MEKFIIEKTPQKYVTFEVFFCAFMCGIPPDYTGKEHYFSILLSERRAVFE